MSTLPAALRVSLAPPGDLDLVGLVLGASGVVLVVLFLLICLSVISWYVIGYKYFFLSRAHAESIHFLDAFWQAKRLDAVYQQAEQKRKSPLAQLFKAGYVELSKLQNQKAKQEGTGWGEGGDDLESIERALRRSQTSQTTQLESMVPFLATVGSAAPFIGLVRTVWGIMDSVPSIGTKGSANLATWAP